jgi:hypothetical protein
MCGSRSTFSSPIVSAVATGRRRRTAAAARAAAQEHACAAAGASARQKMKDERQRTFVNLQKIQFDSASDRRACVGFLFSVDPCLNVPQLVMVFFLRSDSWQ